MSTRFEHHKGEGAVPKTVGARIMLPSNASSGRSHIKRRVPNPPSSQTTRIAAKGASGPRPPPNGPNKIESSALASQSLVEIKTAGKGSRSRHTLGRNLSSDCLVHARPGSGRSAQGSARSTRSEASVAFDNEDESVEQDVRFINIDSKNPSASGKHEASLQVFERETREISVKSVLISAQESDPNNVFEVILHGAQIGRISNLDKFIKIRILDLSCNFIQKLCNLSNNTDIRELKLYDNEIAVIEHLDHLKELCHLQLQHNRIQSIGKGLNSLRKLRVLRLDSNNILKLDVRDFAAVSLLTSLDISNNKLDSIAAVNSLPNLEELSVLGNRLRVVSDLSRCKKLHEIDLSNNRLTDLSGLKQLPHLTILHAKGNFLSNLKGLGKVKSLQELNISNNRITEVRPLVNYYPALQILDVSSNKVEVWEDVCSLKSLPELVELYITDNPFCSENGYKPMYHSDLTEILSQLDILDGAHVKKQMYKPGTPLMRPMSASSVISSRQVESQLKSFESELASFQTSIMSKFESFRSMANDVCPPEVVETLSRSSSAASDRPTSKCGKRSRIKQAIEFASNQDEI